ncbi:hypothetical protein OG562_45495 [Streptomyces sp. NBC_01275]|uniref:hypothetical protein n=1 Tax=Streptomyces sp. NBC_01275 TaxID=2903807 RepID=UPI00224CB99B|nr:hypothetical protein [Streptomyces sp. NBC_01275]MCX4768054.1 hypothetical protein [Streptomyces sp. NBC_01275]
MASQSGAAQASVSSEARSVSPANFQAVQVPYRRQHAGGVGALLAARLHQAPALERGQQQVERLLFQPLLDRPRAELRQRRGVEPRIVQIQTERVFEVHAVPHPMRCRPVGEVLGEL